MLQYVSVKIERSQNHVSPYFIIFSLYFCSFVITGPNLEFLKIMRVTDEA